METYPGHGLVSGDQKKQQPQCHMVLVVWKGKHMQLNQ